VLNAYKKSLDGATKFIPGWVKIVVAIALGSAPWSAGSASSSPSARRSARPT
jgi:hypothetical protein